MPHPLQLKRVNQHGEGVQLCEGIVVPAELGGRGGGVEGGGGEEGGDGGGVVVVPADEGKEVEKGGGFVASVLFAEVGELSTSSLRETQETHHIVFHPHISRPLTQLRPIRINQQRQMREMRSLEPPCIIQLIMLRR